MKQKRRRFTAEFKLKVILESLKERSTLTEIAQKHDLHPNQISKWKADFVDNALKYMQPPADRDQGLSSADVDKLYAKIGHLQMENDFLKKRFC